MDADLKKQTELRAAVQQIELECEQVEQDFLARRIDALRRDGTLVSGAVFDSQKAVVSNLEALATVLNVRLDAQDKADLDVLTSVSARLNGDF